VPDILSRYINIGPSGMVFDNGSKVYRADVSRKRSADGVSELRVRAGSSSTGGTVGLDHIIDWRWRCLDLGRMTSALKLAPTVE